MPRWFQQRDQYSCGVIALLNALSWAGMRITRKHYWPHLKRICATNKQQGTRLDRLCYALKLYSDYLTLESISENIALRNIDTHLKNGGACILTLSWKERNKLVSHYVLCIAQTRNHYQLINYYTKPDENIAFIPKRIIKYELELAKQNNKELVFFLRKNNNV